MNIKIVSDKTGLTKKAIKYYENEGLISPLKNTDTLLRIFPGNFGRIIVTMYELFLRIKIDNDEKKKTWLKLVEFLDSVDEVDENDYLIKEINKFNTHKLDEVKKRMDTKFKDLIDPLINYDENIKNNMVNHQTDFAKDLKGNEEVKQKFSKTIEIAKHMLKIIGPIQKDFEDYLCVLNEDYKKYRENNTKMVSHVNEAVKDKLGFTTNELIK